jgi:hypothetical protein
METPREYVKRIIAEMPGGSTAMIAQRAQRLGYKLSAGYVANISAGTADNLTIQLARALAAGLGRPEEEVLAVFRGKQLTDEVTYKESLFAVMWCEFSQLSGKDQKELRPVIEMLQREIQRRLE